MLSMRLLFYFCFTTVGVFIYLEIIYTVLSWVCVIQRKHIFEVTVSKQIVCHVVVENIRSDNSSLEIQIRSNSLLILLNNNINKDMYMFNKLEVYGLVGIYITKQLLKYQYFWQIFNLLSNNITC